MNYRCCSMLEMSTKWLEVHLKLNRTWLRFLKTYGTVRKILTWQWLYNKSQTVESRLSCKMMIRTSLVGHCSLRRETSNLTRSSQIKEIILSIQFLAITSALLYVFVSIQAIASMTLNTYEQIYSAKMVSVQSRMFKHRLSMHRHQCLLDQTPNLYRQHELFPTTLPNKTGAAHSSDNFEFDFNLFIF